MSSWKAFFDDFGLSKEINAGILQILTRQEIAGVSVMAVGPNVEFGSSVLLKSAGQTKLGLHLVLPIDRECRELLGSLSDQSDKDLIIHQLGVFRSLFRRLPDYFDGHRHAHLHPSRAQTIANVLTQQLGESPTMRVGHYNIWRSLRIATFGEFPKVAALAFVSYWAHRFYQNHGCKVLGAWGEV